MPELDGFGVLAALEPDELPLVVFVTAYDRYALRAFEVHALDYLLKPFDDERFAEALGRAKARARGRDVEAVSRRLVELLSNRGGSPPPAAGGGDFATRLLARSAGRVSLVNVEEIDWIEASDYYARIHAGRVRHLIRESLGSVERRLDPGRFARVHRSAIVNLDRVRERRPLFKGSYAVVLADGTRLPLARSRRALVKARLAGKG